MKAPHSKCGVRATVSGVRIPPSPPAAPVRCRCVEPEYMRVAATAVSLTGSIITSERLIVAKTTGQIKNGPLDFCILGAAKSGKSGLRTYLRTHPQVFMPERETNFYADDLNFAEYEPQRRAKDRQAYCELFAGAAEGQLLGEMSGAYLWSEPAVPNILKDSPEARFIVMMRNPIDTAHASHSYFFRRHFEDEPSFLPIVRKVLTFEPSRCCWINAARFHGPKHSWGWDLGQPAMGRFIQIPSESAVYGRRERLYSLSSPDSLSRSRQRRRMAPTMFE